MDASHAELVLEDIKARLIAGDVQTERNIEVPVNIPAEGLAILRDGDPGEAERNLGGFESSYYTHNIELELMVQAAVDSVRDTKFDALLIKVRDVLYADKTLGGLIFGFETSRPEALGIPVEGGVPIKAAVLILTVEYEIQNPLG